jgi:hypothetical protein
VTLLVLVGRCALLPFEEAPEHVGGERRSEIHVDGYDRSHPSAEVLPAMQKLEVDGADFLDDLMRLLVVVEKVDNLVVIVERDVLHHGMCARDAHG